MRPPNPKAFKFRLHQIVITLLTALISVMGFSTVKGLSSPPVSSPVTLLSSSSPFPYLERQKFPNGLLYTLIFPHNAPAKLKLGVAATLAGVDSLQWNGSTQEKPAQEKNLPLFVINGGFFDPQNQQTTSHLIQNGIIVGDPRKNAHLINNPGLTPYLSAILNRSEFRIYRCQKRSTISSDTNPFIRYDIVPHQEPIPSGCKVWDAAGAGPMLLPSLSAETEGFIANNAAGRVIRDPIGITAKNARSAIGLNAQGDVIFMLGTQHSPSATDEDSVAASRQNATEKQAGNGFSLNDMADFMKAHGAIKAMALDGGSSSGLVYRNKAIYGKFNSNGSPVKRPVKSVWMIIPQ